MKVVSGGPQNPLMAKTKKYFMAIAIGLTLIFLLSLVGFFEKADAVRMVAELTDEQRADRGLPPREEEAAAQARAQKAKGEDEVHDRRSVENGIHTSNTLVDPIQSSFRKRVENRKD